MDDLPVDVDLDSLPISPNSSVLEALYDLSPPSPVLTPSQLAFTWSSGDIPVVLYDDAYRDEISSSQLLGSYGSKRNSSDSLRANRMSVSSNRSRRGSAKSSRVAFAGFGSLDSSDTITSAGTFGPKRRSLRASDGAQGGVSLEGMISKSRTSLPMSANRDSSFLKISGSFFQDPSTSIDRSVENVSSEPTRRVALDHAESDYCADENFSSVGTREKKSTSWISSRDWDNQQYKDFVARAGSPVHRQHDYFLIDTPHSKIGSTGRPVPEQHAAKSESPRAQMPNEIQEHRRDKSLSEQRIGESPVTPGHHHAEDHSWLKGLAVQFLVDQEGFRAARPCFKFSGIVRLRSSPEAKYPDTLMAQFRPIAGQSFHFHHAPFESPPILRRITLNDDETHDYVSKQAHLTLKSNGVYVVYGHELFSADHHSEPVKLHWQFEYFVDDRRVDASKRDMEGEKMLTPHTFSCSPNLLLPAQAKRINIMHVFKKGVGPKLVAEKLLPPGVPRGLNHPAPGTGGSQTEAHFLSKALVLNLHKRGQSHGVKHGDGQHLHTNRHHRAVTASPESKPHSKHRRASSAGERPDSRSAASRLSDHMIPRHRRDSSHRVALEHGPPTARHIIPPVQLVEMLGSSSKENQPLAPPAKFERHSSEFVPLTPRPRHAHQPSRGM